MVARTRPELSIIGMMAVLSLLGTAATAVADESPVTDLGPASLSSAIVTGVLAGDRAVVVTRGITPANVGVLDRTTGQVSTHALPSSQGAWASAVIGDDVYIATYVPAVVYRIAPDGTSTRIAAVPALQYFFDLAATPDGQLVAGGYSNGHTYTIDPTTGAVRDLGQAAAGEQYVRSVAADDTTVYVGVGSHAHLKAIDRVTNASVDILPAELRDDSFVYDVAVTDTFVVAAMNPSGRIAVIDKADPANYRIAHPAPDSVGGADALAISGNRAFVTVRPTGALFGIDLDTGAVTDLGIPAPGEETRNLYVDGDRVIGFGGSGVQWTKTLSSGAVEVLDLQAAGLTPSPELPLSVVGNHARVVVGGNFGLQLHDLEAGTSRRIRIGGEAKTGAVAGNTAYLALYPVGAVETVDLTTGAVRRLSTLGHAQIRPRDLTRADGLVLVGTQPDYGQLGGALSVVAERTGATDVYRDVVPDQSISAVATADGTAYLGSEIYGGVGSTPKAKEAVLAFFDLGTRTATRSLVPVPGAARIQDLLVMGQRVVGITSTGVLFEVDRATGQVTRTLKLSANGGQLQKAGSWFTLTDGDRVIRVEVGSWRVTTIVSGLASAVGGETQGVLDPASGTLTTFSRTNLVQVDVH